jgi:protein gp37
MAESSIEWTDATWNPVAGCTVISPGCTNCYAMRMAARLDAMGMPKYRSLTRRSGRRSVWTGRISLDQPALHTPLEWSKPRMVFVNSMSDLFHEGVPASFIERVWEVMSRAGHHTFQILTKRVDRMAALVPSLPLLPNVWLGTSVENTDYLWRLEALRRIDAAIRFASFEPLLGSVTNVELQGIDWAIVGGESGPGARRIRSEWVEEIRDACRRAGTAFFFKQWGGTNKKRAGRKFEGRTWDEFPVSRLSGCVTPPSAQA